MGGQCPLLMAWHDSAMISRIVWKFEAGFLERISRLHAWFCRVEGIRTFQSVTVLGRINERCELDDISAFHSRVHIVRRWSSCTGIAATGDGYGHYWARYSMMMMMIAVTMQTQVLL